MSGDYGGTPVGHPVAYGPTDESDCIDVTISLPQVLANALRGHEPPPHPGSSPERLVTNVAQLVRDALPEPAHVPVAGDVVTVSFDDGDSYHDEFVKFVDDGIVVTCRDGEDTLWRRVPQITFTLETPAVASQGSASVSEGSIHCVPSVVVHVGDFHTLPGSALDLSSSDAPLDAAAASQSSGSVSEGSVSAPQSAVEAPQ